MSSVAGGSERTPLLNDSNDDSQSRTNGSQHGVFPSYRTSTTSTIVAVGNDGGCSGDGDGNGGEVGSACDPENGVQSQDDRKEPSVAFLLSLVLPMAIGIFLTAMDQTIIVSSYAAIGSELKQLQKTSWIATSYMLTLTSFQPLYGKLSDIFGRKSCLITSYAIFGFGCLLCGLSRTMDELVASRAIAGIGAGGMSTVGSIIMSDVVPLRSRGTWQGVLNIIFSTGSVTGAPLGGFLAETIGWRWSFLIQVPPIILAIISAQFALNLPPTMTSTLPFKSNFRRIDFSGAISLVLTVFFLLFGLERGGNVAWNDPITISTLVAFSIFCILFLKIETKYAKEPFAPSRVIFSRNLLPAFLVNFFGLASAMALLFHISLYLQAVQGLNATQAGWWLIPSMIAGVTGSLAGGLVMQAVGRFYWVTVGSYVLQLSGVIVVFAFTNGFGTGWVPHGLIMGQILVSSGNGSGITTSLIALIANAGDADQAIATAGSYLFRSLGMVVGVSLGSTTIQTTLRKVLLRDLEGVDVDDLIMRVRESLQYISELPEETQIIVKSAYSDAIHAGMILSVFWGFWALVCSLWIRDRDLPSRK